MTLREIIAAACIAMGVFFFIAAGTGLIRFPDTHSRLHALTKADNQGLGWIILGLLILQNDVWIMLKLLLLWVVTLVSSATNAYLLAQRSLQRKEEEPV